MKTTHGYKGKNPQENGILLSGVKRTEFHSQAAAEAVSKPWLLMSVSENSKAPKSLV